MRTYRTKKIKAQAQAFTFCAVCIWMLVSKLSAFPAIASNSHRLSSIPGYPDVVTYLDYAYASAPSGAEAISYKELGKWHIACRNDHPLKGSELVERCKVPIGIARHLRVLKREGVSHEIYVANL